MQQKRASNSFDSFMSAWKRPCEQVQSGLDVLKTFPQVEPILRVNLAEGDQLTQTQYDWLNLQPRLSGSEKAFFNPAWVPIERNGIETFVDITTDRLPVFSTLYTPFNGGSWKRIPVAESLRSLLRAAPRSTELLEMRERIEASLLRAAQGDLFDSALPHPLDARNSGFLPDVHALFLSTRISRRIARLSGNAPALVVETVSPQAVALFPPACEVTLDHFDFAPTLFDREPFIPVKPRGVATLSAMLANPAIPELTLMSGTLHHPQFSVRFRWEKGVFTLSQAPYQVMWYFDALIDQLRRDRKNSAAAQ